MSWWDKAYCPTLSYVYCKGETAFHCGQFYDDLLGTCLELCEPTHGNECFRNVRPAPPGINGTDTDDLPDEIKVPIHKVLGDNATIYTGNRGKTWPIGPGPRPAGPRSKGGTRTPTKNDVETMLAPYVRPSGMIATENDDEVHSWTFGIGPGPRPGGPVSAGNRLSPSAPSYDPKTRYDVHGLPDD